MELFLPAPAIGGACLTFVGELFHVIGLATPNWMEYNRYFYRGSQHQNQGLFQECNQGYCLDLISNSTLKAIQALAILGMIFGLASSLVITFFMVLVVLGKPTNPLLRILSLMSGIHAALCIYLAVIVFASNIYKPAADSSPVETMYNYGYSFALTNTGGAFLLLGSIFFYWGVKNLHQAETESQPISEEQ